jgi:2-polyprenyl-6-hydroxyphenyl methylase/3-demethylubiquinone-9 3-methyltransferase
MMTATTNLQHRRLEPDQKEIDQFNGLADVWWDAGGPMWPLHKLNNLRAPFVQQAIQTHFGADSLKGITILDIGCGAGLLAEAMATLGATVTGVDPAVRNILIARQHAQQSKLNIEYLEGSIEVIEGRCFDVVLNMEVVEHVEDLIAFMAACNRAVAPGGLEIVATLNRNIRSFIFAIVGAEYILGWLPKGTHQWRKFVTPTELTRLLAADKLKTFDQAGVSVNPFTRAYRVSKDTRVNYMLLAARHA